METDSVKTYMKEIGRIPLLTAEQEICYARDVQAGFLAKAALEQGEGSEDLRKQVKRGERAKDKLVEGNLRLVVAIARTYIGKTDGMNLLDLVQEGNLGLMDAVDRFDPEKGCKFSTYAFWWIHQHIRRSIDDKDRILRVPVYIEEYAVKVSKASAILTQELGRKPTTEELAENVNLSVNQVKRVLTNTRQIASLDTPMTTNKSDDSDITLANAIPCEVSYDVIRMENKFLAEGINEILLKLTPKEKEIVVRRYGLGGRKGETLEEIGKAFGVTRERIRQIENSALKKLYWWAKVKELDAFFDAADTCGVMSGVLSS